MSALVGIGMAIVLILVGMILKGGTIASIISPPAFVMVMGATFGVMMASSGMGTVGLMMKLSLGSGMKDPPENRPETINLLVGFSEKARREGLLALEADAQDLQDEYLKKGIRLVVDGTDPELVKDILETELAQTETRHRVNQQIFKNGGAFAPTIGILATVLSLIGVLKHLDQPDTLGPKISAAFLATFYGVAAANVYFYPMGNHLARHTAAEVALKELIIEGILSIQSGDNPRVLAEKLWAFVPPALRTPDEGAGAGADEDRAAA